MDSIDDLIAFVHVKATNPSFESSNDDLETYANDDFGQGRIEELNKIWQTEHVQI